MCHGTRTPALTQKHSCSHLLAQYTLQHRVHTHTHSLQLTVGFQHGFPSKMCSRDVFVSSMGSRGPWCRSGKGVPASSPGLRVTSKGPLGKQETQRREGSGKQKKGTQPRMFTMNTGLCRTDQQISFLGGRGEKLEVPSPGLRSCSPNSLAVPRSCTPPFLLIRPFCPSSVTHLSGSLFSPDPQPFLRLLSLPSTLPLPGPSTHPPPAPLWAQCAALSGL